MISTGVHSPHLLPRHHVHPSLSFSSSPLPGMDFDFRILRHENSEIQTHPFSSGLDKTELKKGKKELASFRLV